MNKEMMLESLKYSDSDKTYNLVKDYIKRYGAVNLINSLSLDDERKKYVYKYILDIYTYGSVLFSNLKNEKDKYLFYEFLCDYYGEYDYSIFKKLKNPKENLKKEYVDTILNNVSVEELIYDFGLYFKEEILNTEKFYLLLKEKDKLDSEFKKKIYDKVNTYDEYVSVKEYLNGSEITELSTILIKKENKNIDILYDLYINNYYTNENEKYLVDTICKLGSARILYNVLKSEKLDEVETKEYEKSLYDTNNIEYIAYYYFYHNKEKFNLLFKSAILFLSYVSLNRDKFKNNTELDKIINIIKEENVDFSTDIEKGIAYKKKYKIEEDKK